MVIYTREDSDPFATTDRSRRVSFRETTYGHRRTGTVVRDLTYSRRFFIKGTQIPGDGVNPAISAGQQVLA